MEVSIVLPAYNEALNLQPLLFEINEALGKLGWDYEVIVVNDGSSDGSRELLDGLAVHDSHLKPIHHERNRGYGGALQSGFAAATKPWIFFMDADRQFDIREIALLAEKSDRYDYIAGYRANRQDHWMRKLNAWLFHLGIAFCFGLWYRDIDCAFKLIRREIIERAKLESQGAFINTELLLRARQYGYRIFQLPVSHYPRTKGNPTGANPAVILRAIKEIIIFRFF